MFLNLKVLSGPHKDLVYTAAEGFVIGRSQGDLTLSTDLKVSSVHAKIEKDNKNQLVLVDQDSANGLSLGGRRVRKIALIPGLRFKIGDTQFEVESGDKSFKKSPPLHLNIDQKIDSFLKNLQQQISGSTAHPATPLNAAEGTNRFLESFSPMLSLEFIQGPQSDDHWLLGYGPRTAGFGSLDLNLIDFEAPELGFYLKPALGGAVICDLSFGKVLLNNSKINEEVFLNDGDILSFGQTKIKIRFEDL